MALYTPYLRQKRRPSNFDLINPPPPTREAKKATAAEKLEQAISLISEVRTDEKIRDTDIETDLALVQEMLTRLAKGERIADLLTPKEEESPIRTFRIGEGIVPAVYPDIEEVGRARPGYTARRL